ncbi:hypothetical protein GCM10009834_01690 [Streptomonospora arabica]
MSWLGPVLQEGVRVVGDALDSWSKTTRLAALILVIGGATALVVGATTFN